MIFPETSDFVQPLAGEYAGSRDFLENSVFYSGYSVEVALLLQATLDYGLEHIAQVSLGERIHPLQDVPSLGKMAGNIMYTLFYLAERYNRITLETKVNPYIRFFSAVSGTVVFE